MILVGISENVLGVLHVQFLCVMFYIIQSVVLLYYYICMLSIILSML